MSQGIFSTINPNTTSGTQLATILDDFKDAMVSGLSGTSRPVNLQANGYWIDTTDAGTNILVYKLYDGTNDITVFTINTSTQGIILPGVADEFEIIRTSDDSIGPKVVLEKRRIAGGGQVLENDILGDHDFQGNDASLISYVQARIRVVSTDDVSPTEQGCYMAMSVTPTNGSALTEVLRLTGDKRIGVGIAAPLKTIHAFSNDSTGGIQSTIAEDSVNAPDLALQKKRLASLGQVLNADNIGSHTFKSVDETGAVIDVAKINVAAIQDHTTANQGVSLTISTKSTNTNTFTEALKLEDGVVSLYGQQITEVLAPGANLLAGTNSLLSVDGTIYGAFKATIYMHGANATITRQQEIVLKGVYDFDNTTWKITEENDSMGGTDKVATITTTDAPTVLFDYTNQIPTFVAGKIYVQIKRYLR